jgi:Skp family chaperone for outer membrane proteins
MFKFENSLKATLAVLVLTLPAVSRAADASKVKEKASETATAAGDYAKETREDFKKGVEGDLAKLQTEINELKKKATEASGAAQDSLDRQIAELDVKKMKLRKKLDEATKTTSAAWIEMRAGISKALDELKVGFNKAKDTASGTAAEPTTPSQNTDQKKTK